MADVIPNIFLEDMASKKIDFINDEMKLALFVGEYNICNMRCVVSYNDIIDDEVEEGLGYNTGGMSIYEKTLTFDEKTNELVFDLDDVGFTIQGGTFGPVRYGVLYNLSNNNNIVYVFDFDEDKTVNDGASFKIKIDDAGLFRTKQNSNCTC